MKEKRQQSHTGAVKNNIGKLRYDLIPVIPLMELARVYTIGSFKYADRNWEKGLPWSWVYSAMMSHAFKFWGWRERLDPVDKQHHMGAVAWGAFALMEYERTHPELDDRPQLATSITKEELDFLTKIENTKNV